MKKIIWPMLFLVFFSCARNDFDQALKQQSLPIDFEGLFTLKSFSPGPFILIGESIENKGLIKINVRPIPNDSTLDKELKKQIVRIASQFQFSMAPYPGQLTQAINCGKRFQPRIIKENKISIIKAFANKRLALSICQSDEFSYDLITAYFLDAKSNQLISVEIYQSNLNSSKWSYGILSKYFNEYQSVSLDQYESLFKIENYK